MRIRVAVVVSLVFALHGFAAASDPTGRPIVRGAEVSAPVTPFVFEGDLRLLAPAPRWQPGDPIKEIPRRLYPKPGTEEQYRSRSVPTVDPLLEVQQAGGGMTSAAFGAPSRNFPGQGYTGVNPPDTVGDVGPAYYIQMVNSGGGAIVQIFDKAEPVPNPVASFALDSLGGGSCASGYGDPIVLYDRFADRWMLSEFSSSGNNLCVYVSQTGDPVTGGWFNYQFTAPSFPDYPKYGVWPTDANGGSGSYVVTANDGGPGIYALDRGAMLSGSAGTYQRVTIPELPGFLFQAPTPADVDGPDAPPSGSPAIIMRHRDTENHSGPAAPGDLLEMWSFDVDWTTPANTTLVTEPSIDVTEFDSDLCGLTSFYCFPMPGTSTTLDPLREVIMFRLQYINHGTHETLVGNLVTDVDGTDHGGLRWFELRGGAGAWALHQEGTYAPDADHRWMAASAMDQSGNIAIAYSVSSSSTFPSLRYTGRLDGDAAGVLTQPESEIHSGTASNSSNRWGDYAAMNLDPVDDCTFWFTSMDNTSSSWRTQIASFAFDACGCELAPSALTVSAAVAGDNEIEIGWSDADLATVVEYSIGRSFTPGGPYETIATVADTSPGVAGGPDHFFIDTDVSGGVTYYYIVRATDGLACTSEDSNEASATATGVCTLVPLFDGLQSAGTPFSGLCTIELAWPAATARCGGPIDYNVYRSTVSAFEPGPGNLLVSGVTATFYADMNTLTSDVPHYYVVRAVDQAIGAEESNLVEVEAVPQGPLTSGTWLDDAGDTGSAKMIPDTPWQIEGSEGNLGPSVYKTGDYGDNTCAGLTSPEMRLGTGSVLSFVSRYEIEDGWDKGEVQISTDGVFWQRVELDYPGTSTQASDHCGFPTGDYFTGTDLEYSLYTADLSGWADQVVQIRFVMSSDGSLTESGWWIDDISITNVDVPGTCTTGSACPENPIVNVVPEGPSTVCRGERQLLTATLSGGSGPFSFQWTRDGIDIANATGDTLVVDDFGAHAYNCKVSAESCPDEVFDGLDTEITWVDAPYFDGVQSVADGVQSTCSIDVGWNPASTFCPGPVTYSIYRDTSTPVDPIPQNLVASGIGGSSFTDSLEVVVGTDYHYLVRAVEQTTGVADSNVVEGSASASGPGGGLQTLFAADFDGPGGISAWTVTTGPGPHDCGEWAAATSSSQLPDGGSGTYALADSDACGSGSTTSTALDSPVIDVAFPGVQSVTLDYDVYYNHYNGDDATVEAWDGSEWQVVWADSDVDVNGHQSIDVTPYAAGNADFRVRFNYQNASYDYWFAVDNVEVTAFVSTTCETAVRGPAPPPVPDGALSTTPLRAARLGVSGDAIDVFWDATSCPATDYDLIFGDLADVGTYTLAGAECGLDSDGSYGWTGVPAGSLYFIVVGTDGAGIESSWGTNSDLVERNGPSSSNECSTFLKDASIECP
jgi:hypothetical protein